MIELDKVSKTFGQKVAVAELDLVVPAGELFAFLGPNGAGKTTTIKMLVGLLRPVSGHVRLCGYDLATDSRSAYRLLGYVPDEPYLYEKLTGREFLRFLTGMHGLNGSDAARQIDEAIADFELTEFVDELTETYSLGMKQRLAFAGALIHSPSVLVVDEPMVGLDPRSTRLVKDLLRAKVARGMTVFMSTHTLPLAEEIADRIGIVDRGRMRCCGTLAQLREQLAWHHTTLEQVFLEVTSGGNPAPASLATERE